MKGVYSMNCRCQYCGETNKSKFTKGSRITCNVCRRTKEREKYQDNIEAERKKRKKYAVDNKIRLKRLSVEKYRDDDVIKREDREALKLEKRQAREERMRKSKLTNKNNGDDTQC